MSIITKDLMIAQVISALSMAMKYTAANRSSADSEHHNEEDKLCLVSSLSYDLKIKELEDKGIYGATMAFNVELVNCSLDVEEKAWVWAGDVYHVWVDAASVGAEVVLVFKDIDGKPVDLILRDGFSTKINIEEVTTATVTNDIAERAFATLNGIERGLMIREVLASHTAKYRMENPQ